MRGTATIADITRARDGLVDARRVLFRVGQDAGRDYATEQLTTADDHLAKLAAGIAGGARRWHENTAGYLVAVIVAAAVAWPLWTAGAWAWLVLVAATTAGGVAGPLAIRAWVRTRHRTGTRHLTDFAPSTRGPYPTDVTATIRGALLAVSRVRTTLDRDGLGRVPIPSPSWWGVDRAEYQARHAWRATARAVARLAGDPLPPTAHQPQDVTAYTTADQLLAASRALQPVLNELDTRGSGVELAVTVSRLQAAQDVVRTTAVCLGASDRYPDVSTTRKVAAVAVPPVAYAVALWLLWGAVPLPIVAAGALLAALVIGDVAGEVTTRWPQTPFAATVAATRKPPIELPSIRAMAAVWAQEITDQDAQLRHLAAGLVTTDPAAEPPAWAPAVTDNLANARRWLTAGHRELTTWAAGM